MVRLSLIIFFVGFTGFLLGLCVWGVVSGLVNPIFAILIIGGEFALIYVNFKKNIQQTIKPLHRAKHLLPVIKHKPKKTAD